MIIIGRKQIAIGMICIITGLAVGATVVGLPYLKTFHYGKPTQLSVIVDAGHGDPDGGTVGTNGTIEQKINLEIAKKLQEVLEGKGIHVIMTRTTDSGLQSQNADTIRQMKREDMQRRRKIMEESNADLFISIHMNYFDSEKIHGLRLFYDKAHPEMEELAEIMQEKMGAVTGAEIKAVKTADTSLFLMKNPPVPCVLVECGFLSNPEEEKKLNDADYQARLAWAMADVIEKFFR